MADATTVPLGVPPRAGRPGGLPRRGRPAAVGDRSDQRREERRAQAARRGHPDRRALPVHQRPRDRGRAGHGRDPARPRRRRRPPGRQRLRGRLGRRRVAVRPARGGGPDARQLHPARARCWRASAGSSSATRAATGSAGGRSTCTSRRCARSGASIEYRNGYYFATSPGRLRGGEVRFPFVSVMGTENAMLAATLAEGTHDHPAGRPGARGRRPHRVPPGDGRRGRADLPRTRSRSRAASACAAPSTAVIPDRIEAGTFIVAAAVTGGQVTLEGAPCDHLGAFVETAGPGRRRRRPAGPTRSRSTARPLHDGGYRAPATSRPRRTRVSPPTSSHRRPCC